jgi:CheY-like chemotaxis protein
MATIHRGSADEQNHQRMPRNVLIVNEDRATREVFCSVLCHHGYDAAAVESGDVALARMADLAVDLVIMEDPRYLPGGATLLSTVRASQAFAGTKILLATSRGPRLGPSGAGEYDGFLLKPVRMPVLLAEVERLIGPADPAADVPLPVRP